TPRIELPFVTKLQPPRPRQKVLARPALLKRLVRNIGLRVQVLCAGAGHGKTTLLTQLLKRIRAPICWYSLEASDGDPRQFLTYLLAGLEKAIPQLGERFQRLQLALFDVSREPASVVGQLVTLLEHSGFSHLVIVLDDFHTIEESRAVGEVITPLLERSPSMLHIILASRTMPNLPILTRLLAQREAAIVREGEIRLTNDEVGKLLAIQWGKKSDTATINEVFAWTEGWAAGVVLYSLAGTSTTIGATTAEGDMFAFLASEVLEQQPDELRRFMLVTSIPEELNPVLCARLTGRHDSRVALAELERRNTFLTRVSRDTYRYHQLFRSFLRSTLQRQEPSQFASLCVEAARYFKDLGRMEEAIGHFLEGEEPGLAAESIEAVGKPLFDQGHWSTLARWIDSLPGSICTQHPTLFLLRGQVAGRLGDPISALELLTKACDHFEASGHSEDLISSLLARSSVCRFQGNHTQSQADAKRAMDLAKAVDGLAHLLPYTHRQLGLAYAHKGEFHRARRHFLRAVRLLPNGANHFEVAMTHGNLGALYTELGDAAQALVHYRKACEIWQRVGNPGELAETLNNMAVLFYFQGELDIALDAVTRGLEQAREAGYTRVEATLLVTLGDILAANENYEEALGSYQRGTDLGYHVLEAQASAYGSAAIGECYRLMGQWEKARIFLQQAAADAQFRHQRFELGLYHSALGALANDQGAAAEALEHLLQASQLLTEAGHRYAEAIARLRLAHSFLIARQFAPSLQQLKQVQALCDTLGTYIFLLPEAKRQPALMQYVSARRIGGSASLTKLATRALEAPTSRQVPAISPASSLSSAVEAYGFDRGAVHLNGQPVPDEAWESGKAKEIFFFLLSKGTGAQKEEIVAAIWPDSELPLANNAFHTAVHRVRRALGPDGLVYRERRYELNPEWHWWVDVTAFSDNLKSASDCPQGSPERQRKLLEAVGIHKGPYLPWCYGDWCEELRTQFEEQYLGCLLNLGTCYKSQREWQKAVEALEQAFDLDPYRELVVAELMQSHMGLGDAAAAAGVYARYATLLRRELQAEPSPALVALSRELTAGALG
ncbi:MAG: tetratricopeptide repeat protein, partial [Dehalococcoidia bacterium]